MNRNVCYLHCTEYTGNSFKRLSFVTSAAEARLTINRHITKSLKCIMWFGVRTPCLICCWTPHHPVSIGIHSCLRPVTQFLAAYLSLSMLKCSQALREPRHFSNAYRNCSWIFHCPFSPPKNSESVKARIILRSLWLSLSDARDNTNIG